MKPDVSLKYLQYLRNKKQNGEEGFTLIELLVVVIIIGVLAAVALPNLLNQVGKARETEIKNAVGTVNRSQQAYHFERQTFATTLPQLGLENITTTAEYLNTTAGVTVAGNDTFATVISNNDDAVQEGTRAYSASITFNTGNATYQQILCQTDAVGTSGLVVTDTASTACPASSAEVR